MRNKSIILLLAVVCGTVAAIGISQWMQARNTPVGETPTIEVFVVEKQIDSGEIITADKIRLEAWPKTLVKEGSVSDLTLIEGKFARQTLFVGEPILTIKLSETNTATIPKGFSVVSMKADPENSSSSLVRPGDLVDVRAYFTKSELIPRTMTMTVLDRVRIYSVDGKTERETGEDRTTRVNTIGLLIHSEDVDAWTYANELGKIRLSLLNPGEYINSTKNDGANPSGQAFMAWLADYQKAQEALRLAADDEADTGPVLAPAPFATAEPKKKKNGFKMLKMVEGRLIEYWIADNEVPVIVSDTGSGLSESNDSTSGGSTQMTSTALPPNGSASPPNGQPDYSYLNGENSPFFQPPTERTGAPEGF